MAGYDAVETKENLNEEVYTIFFKSSFDKQDFGIWFQNLQNSIL